MSERALWDGLVEDYGPRLYRFFQHKGFREEASDCVQETFLRLMEKHRDYNPEKGTLRSFLFGVAQNIAFEKMRKKKKWLVFHSADEDVLEKQVDPECLQQALEIRDHTERLEFALTFLSQEQKDLVYLYYDEELTTREISESLHMSEGTVKSHLSRAREKLRNLLGEEMSHG